MTDLATKVCSIIGCDRDVVARELCNRHYLRERRYGDPLGGANYRTHPEKSVEQTEQRFWSKVNKDGPTMPGMETSCWVWTAAKRRGSAATDPFYGEFRLGAQMAYAHRVSYLWANGELPEAPETIDHRCSNTLCVRPDHLRALPPKGQSQHRRGANQNNGSRSLGVDWNQGKWRVRVMHDGKSHYGGHFNDIADADRNAIALRNALFVHNDKDPR